MTKPAKQNKPGQKPRGMLVAAVGPGSGQKRFDAVNPVRQLTAQRAAYLMECYARGDFADLMWLFAAPYTGLECSDPDYLAIIERRISAVKEMSWKIQRWKPAPDSKSPEDAAKAARAMAQEKKLAETYGKIANLYEAIAHLTLSKFRGFSICEKTETHLLPVDHWNIVRDGSRGKWYWNESGKPGVPVSQCDELPTDRIVLLECPRPIGRFAILKFIRANLSETEWDYFVEIYGIPSGIVIAPDGVNATNIAEFKTAAANVARGADAAFPFGSEYIPNDKARGIQPFQPRLEWLSQKLVQAGTGGYLTMLSMSGSGTLAGSAHMEAFRILARADARDVSEAMQAQIDVPTLSAARLLMPAESPLAWFEISAREEQSPGDAANQVIQLAPHFDLDPAQVEERTGWKVKAKPAAAAPVAGFMRREAPEAMHRAGAYDPAAATQADVDAAAEAILSDLQPVRDLIGKALVDNGGDLRAAIISIEKDLPKLADRVKRGALDDFMESQAAAAMAAMFAELARKGKAKAE